MQTQTDIQSILSEKQLDINRECWEHALQTVTADSIWIVWDTTVAGVGRVEYGETPALGQSVIEQVAGLRADGCLPVGP